jgi:hypothetical protein
MRQHPRARPIVSIALCFGVTVALLTMLLNIETDAAPTAKNQPEAKAKDTSGRQGYRIDQPGTITFTVGMVIKGKIEKPQVMIFLPKENSFHREVKFSRSFSEELNKPLPFDPIIE